MIELELFPALLAPPIRECALYGVFVGIVTNNQDPGNPGRVKVRYPWLSDGEESAWARVATPMAGADRGLYLLPEVDDEVLVAFEHGDIRFPYVLGALWNGRDMAPAANEDGKNNVRMLRSRSGHVIRLDDTDGKEKIEIVDKTGKNSIVLDTAGNTITLAAGGDITIQAGGKLTLSGKGVELASTGEIKVEASSSLALKGQMVDIN